MRVPLRWLSDFCKLENEPDCASILTEVGLEVEEVVTAAPAFTSVVVAEIKQVTSHKNADSLSVCKVDIGAESEKTIVCGASNVSVGAIVACAVPGAVLPGNKKISQATIRGQVSSGMLCSAFELGLSESDSGVILVFADSFREFIGRDLREVLDLDELIFLLKTTPDFGHAMSMYGVARVLSAASSAISLIKPSFETPVVSIQEKLPVRILSPELCGRFSGRVIKNVNTKIPTPDWIKTRLLRIGQRSVNVLVDLSNYVQFSLGSPSHIFDLDKIQGELHVRWAKEGERLVSLHNNQELSLTSDVGVVADSSSVVSLAGIIGGKATAVSDKTQNIYVESAFWFPHAIMGRARRYNLQTDASIRFERGVDCSATALHLDYLSSLIVSICGGNLGPVDDQIVQLPDRSPTVLRLSRLQRLSGLQLKKNVVVELLKKVAFSLQEKPENEDELLLEAPPHRFDLRIEEDWIEEVIRLWGYQKIPAIPPKTFILAKSPPKFSSFCKYLKQALVLRDYQEVITYSFVPSIRDGLCSAEKTPIRLLNPISEHMDVLRTTLWGGLIGALQTNVNRRSRRVRLFEIGRVFSFPSSESKDPSQSLAINDFATISSSEDPKSLNSVAGVVQPIKVGLLAFGSYAQEQWGLPDRSVDFFDLKADIESISPMITTAPEEHATLHPGRSASVLLNGKQIGYLGELHPKLQKIFDLPLAPIIAEISIDELYKNSFNPPVLQEISNFPVVYRDLAFLVPESISYQQVIDVIRQTVLKNPSASIIKEVTLFDQYHATNIDLNKKSLAFRFSIQSNLETLTDIQISQAMQLVVDDLRQILSINVREHCSVGN